MEKVRKKLRSEWFDRLMSDEQILYIEHSIASFYGLWGTVSSNSMYGI